MGTSADQPRSLHEALLCRPALSVAVVFIAGIFAHTHLPHCPDVWLIAGGGALIVALVGRSQRLVVDPCLALAIFLAAVAAAQVQSFCYPSNHIAHFTMDHPRLARVELRIDQAPRILEGQGYGLKPALRTVTQATVLRVLTWNGWRPATGTTLLRIDGPASELAVGQRIVALGTVSRPMAAMNPGQFDWAGYYRQQRILTSLSVSDAGTIRILNDPGPGWLARLRQFVRTTLHRGFAPDQSLDHALLRALLLGDSDPQLRDVHDDFIRTGTSHHLAISGMHVAVLGAVVFFICRLLLLSPRSATWIGLTFVILYGLVALPSPPVVRSVVLCCAYGMGMLGRRSLDGIQLLSLSVFVMLVYQPLDLYDAGFQLSFGTVLGLMLFTRPVQEFLESLRDPDVLVAMTIQRPTGWGAIGLWQRSRLTQGVIAGLVAWAVSAPLIALHFNHVNPWAVPAGLVLAIPVFIALVGGMLKIILTLLLPGMAGTWATLAAGPIGLMRQLADWMAAVPGSESPVQSPPMWIVVVAYVLLALPLLWRLKKRMRWFTRCGPVAACLLVVLLPLFPTSSHAPSRTLRLTLLSVGAGQCAVLHLPSGKLVLIDAGSSSIADLERVCVGPYLKYLGLRQIDTIFISHPNHDHFSAVADAAANHDLRNVCVSTLFNEQASTNASARDMLQALESQKVPVNPLSPGQHLQLDEDVGVDVLWPPGISQLKPNDASLVLRVTYRGRSILFPGDIQESAQRSLLASSNDLNTDVLIAPHHGGSETTTAQFLAAVDSQIILSSNDRTLTQKQRQFEKLVGPRALYRTHHHGAVFVTIDSQGHMQVETYMH